MYGEEAESRTAVESGNCSHPCGWRCERWYAVFEARPVTGSVPVASLESQRTKCSVLLVRSRLLMISRLPSSTNIGESTSEGHQPHSSPFLSFSKLMVRSMSSLDLRFLHQASSSARPRSRRL